MHKTVVFIDDDMSSTRYYRRALELRGFEVIAIRGPDEALEFLASDRAQTMDVVVLDIMLPPGKAYQNREDCRDGLLTGVALHEEIKRRTPHVPVVVLTNMRNREMLDRVPAGTPTYDKIDVPPFRLPEILASIAEKGQD